MQGSYRVGEIYSSNFLQKERVRKSPRWRTGRKVHENLRIVLISFVAVVFEKVKGNGREIGCIECAKEFFPFFSLGAKLRRFELVVERELRIPRELTTKFLTKFSAAGCRFMRRYRTNVVCLSSAQRIEFKTFHVGLALAFMFPHSFANEGLPPVTLSYCPCIPCKGSYELWRVKRESEREKKRGKRNLHLYFSNKIIGESSSVEILFLPFTNHKNGRFHLSLLIRSKQLPLFITRFYVN